MLHFVVMDGTMFKIGPSSTWFNVTPKGKFFFLGTIDITKNQKDHTYVATQILSFVQKVGTDNVVLICTDNAPIMSLAGCDVMWLNPHMYV